MAIGVCVGHEQVQVGHKGGRCPECGKTLQNSRLLYPIKKKDYAKDPPIRTSWSDLRIHLKDAFMFTIFGYGVPASDVEAIALLKEGWGCREDRRMEQIQIIDVLPEECLCKRWDDFIESHHYNTYTDFYSCHIARYARRSCDACFGAVVCRVPVEEAAISRDVGWQELDDWLAPLLEAENASNARKC